jgi:hypothetical protein
MNAMFGLGNFTDRERAALAWTEAVTRVSEGHVPNWVFREARRFFSEKEVADLTLCIVTINSWNRLCIAFRASAGTYQAVPKDRNMVRPSVRRADTNAAHSSWPWPTRALMRC